MLQSGFEPCISKVKIKLCIAIFQKIIISYFASFRIQTSYHKIQFTFSYFCHNQDLNSELFVLFRSKFNWNLEAFSDLSTRRLFTEDRHANGFFFILSLRFRGPLRFFRGLKSSFASIRMEPICLRPWNSPLDSYACRHSDDAFIGLVA